MFRVAADGVLLTPEDDERLRKESEVAFAAGDASRALAVIRYRLGTPRLTMWDFVQPRSTLPPQP